MLLELRVENYAVIDSVVVEFAPGLNLLTGETGAGKSILIDALALLLGEKASTDVIRHGSEKAVVGGTFEVAGKKVAEILQSNGIDDEGQELIVRREVVSGGRGRVFVNNQPATVSVLRQLAPYLAAIHAQNESILAFNAAARLALLDSFCGSDLRPVAETHAKWKSLLERIASLESEEEDRLRQVDLWSFQKKEIEEARLEPGEDVRLETEKRVLANAEKIYSAAMSAYDALYEGNASAAASISAASRQLAEVARFDGKFQETLAALETARITVEDIGARLRDYCGAIDASPERLAEVEDRLASLDRLKRKYGKSLDEVAAYGAEVARKLHELENKDEVVRQLRSELSVAAKAYLHAAQALSKKRFEAARKLEKLLEREINDLAMQAQFKIEIGGSEEEGKWSAVGFDSVAYLIAANAGEALGPVEQIASGGELSRVMLALKATVEAGQKSGASKNREHQRTLVFDEIDSGIGGRAAEAVGKKLKSLAATSQVLCVTHLPQIAAFAEHHYVVEKCELEGRTRTSIRRLGPPERKEEVARMLSGAKLTETSRKHAEQMLKANA